MRIATKADIDFIADAYACGFAFPRDRTAAYIADTGLSNFHIIEQGSDRAAVFALMDTGHWFGGKVVPACNIAHVAIQPEHRGSGLAAVILDCACKEAVRRGAVVASLFASTRPVYRMSGFELAGSELLYEADTAELYKIKSNVRCRRVAFNSLPSVLAPLYSKHCRDQNGLLERGPAHWNALIQTRGSALSVFVFHADGNDLGYIILDTADETCLVLRDWVALSGSAARQILTFLGTFSTVYPRVRWHGGPEDQLVFAMPDKGWRLIHQEEFLMRALSPKAALAARGYGHATGQLLIAVTDGPQRQTLLLTVIDGHATCQDSVSGEADITIGLAQFPTLFSGFRSAYFLSKAGWILGNSGAIKRCNDIFSGPAPWVGEHF